MRTNVLCECQLFVRYLYIVLLFCFQLQGLVWLPNTLLMLAVGRLCDVPLCHDFLLVLLIAQSSVLTLNVAKVLIYSHYFLF